MVAGWMDGENGWMIDKDSGKQKSKRLSSSQCSWEVWLYLASTENSQLVKPQHQTPEILQGKRTKRHWYNNPAASPKTHHNFDSFGGLQHFPSTRTVPFYLSGALHCIRGGWMSRGVWKWQITKHTFPINQWLNRQRDAVKERRRRRLYEAECHSSSHFVCTRSVSHCRASLKTLNLSCVCDACQPVLHGALPPHPPFNFSCALQIILAF